MASPGGKIEESVQQVMELYCFRVATRRTTSGKDRSAIFGDEVAFHQIDTAIFLIPQSKWGACLSIPLLTAPSTCQCCRRRLLPPRFSLLLEISPDVGVLYVSLQVRIYIEDNWLAPTRSLIGGGSGCTSLRMLKPRRKTSRKVNRLVNRNLRLVDGQDRAWVGSWRHDSI